MGLAQTGPERPRRSRFRSSKRLIGGPRRTRALDPHADARAVRPGRGELPQVREAHAGLDVVAVYGGVPLEPQEQKLRAGVDIVVATPGRLLDHLERQNVVFDDLEVLVLDEADRMLDMGFAPQINRIVARDPALSADAALQRDDAARSRSARAQVSAQAGRRAGGATVEGGER